MDQYVESKFDLEHYIRGYFAKKPIRIEVMFDFLNESLLKQVAEFGSKVLHLTSTAHAQNYLFLEDNTGVE